MSQKSLILKGTALLTGGSAVSQILRFVRNVVVARALTPEDFGVAATFWITTGFLMSMTGIGLEKMLVQDKDGDDDHFGAVAQLVLFLRGVLIGAVILLLAYPIASAFKVPEATWAFRLLAVVPLMDGLKHRDILRLQRHMRFGPFMLSQFIPDVAITALAWPIARWAGDYTAFLYIAILHGFVSLITSHMVVERRFKIAWDNLIFSRIFQFGWPLLINNFLIFTMFQGDRIILARAYTKAELGVYSVALSLATTIPTLLGGVFSQVMLPYFSKLQNDRVQLEAKLYFAAMVMALFSALLGVGLVVAGPMLVTLIYSSKYLLAGSVIGWLGIMHTLRMIRQVPTMAAIALGDTFNALFANIFRQSGLVLALIAAMLDYSLVWIAISGVIGEAISVVAIAVSIKKRLNISLFLWHKPLIYFGLSTGSALWLMKFTVIGSSLSYTIVSLCFLEMIIIGIWLSTDRLFREEVQSLMAK